MTSQIEKDIALAAVAVGVTIKKPEDWPQADWEHHLAQQRWLARFEAVAPSLPIVTKIVMAGDFAGAERWEAELRAGKIEYDEAVNLCGSYSRLDFALRMADAGFATRDHLLDRLPEMWPGCDPDDTDPRFIALWREARARSDSYLRDGPDLPPLRPHAKPGSRLTIYRGQPADAAIGCAWTLDRRTAVKFAKGAWARSIVTNGIVLEAKVARDAVAAYLTRRGEAEVIVDPDVLQRVRRRRVMEQRTWSFDAAHPDDAKAAMEAEMARLGHTVLKHMRLEEAREGRWRVTSLIELGPKHA